MGLAYWSCTCPVITDCWPPTTEIDAGAAETDSKFGGPGSREIVLTTGDRAPAVTVIRAVPATVIALKVLLTWPAVVVAVIVLPAGWPSIDPKL